MLVSCWSAKGGVGTTVVAAAIATLLARERRAGVLLVDLAGDLPAVLGIPEPESPGVAGWVEAGASVPPDGLARLEVAAGSGLSLLPRGPGTTDSVDRGEVLASVLAADTRPVVVDCGTLDTGPSVAAAMAAVATRSVLVTRQCYLALRRAHAVPIRPSEVVVITEPGRTLNTADIGEALGAPVRVTIPFDPAVARAVDAGLLATRLPRSLVRSLEPAI